MNQMYHLTDSGAYTWGIGSISWTVTLDFAGASPVFTMEGVSSSVFQYGL
jgi:hypothetical protein